MNLELQPKMEGKMVDETLIKFIAHKIERYAKDNPKDIFKRPKICIDTIEVIILEELKKDEIQKNHNK